MLIVVGSASPFVYVIRHLTQSPERRSFAEPDNDYSWRSQRNLVVNGIALFALACGAIAIIASFLRADVAPAIVYVVFISMFGAWPVYLVSEGLKTGRIMPITNQGWAFERERAKNPKSFWAFVIWNLFVAISGSVLTTLLFASTISEKS